MLLVDVLVVVVLVVALVTGLQRGLLASLGTLVGLIAGGIAAFWVMPLVSAWMPSPEWRGIAVLAAGVGLLLVGAAVGSAIGSLLRSGVDKTPLKGFERFLGGVLSVAVAALVIALVAPTLAMTGMPGVSTAVASSRVLRGIEALTPAPVDSAIAQLRTAVMGDGLPRLGNFLDGVDAPGEGTIAVPVDLDDPELLRAAASVARVSGVAYACGTGSSGSGFVISPDRIVTNAHVVAGVDTPIVELPGRDAREGRVVYFDPIDDLAVIAVDELGATPLGLASPLEASDPAAVQGYPHGGPFSSIAATVLSVGMLPVPDVYARGATPREVYVLASDVQPGNSGGPLLTEDGEVAGVVFARGDDAEARGFAMTTTELAPVVDGVAGMDAAVSSGSCSA